MAVKRAVLGGDKMKAQNWKSTEVLLQMLRVIGTAAKEAVNRLVKLITESFMCFYDSFSQMEAPYTLVDCGRFLQ